MTYSEDLRERAVAAYQRGEGSQREIAERFDVGQSTLSGWLRLLEERGTLTPGKPTGRPRKLTPEQEELVPRLLERRNDLTLDELADDLAEYEIDVSRQTVGRVLQRMGWTRKKNAARSGSE